MCLSSTINYLALPCKLAFKATHLQNLLAIALYFNFTTFENRFATTKAKFRESHKMKLFSSSQIKEDVGKNIVLDCSHCVFVGAISVQWCWVKKVISGTIVNCRPPAPLLTNNLSSALSHFSEANIQKSSM